MQKTGYNNGFLSYIFWQFGSCCAMHSYSLFFYNKITIQISLFYNIF